MAIIKCKQCGKDVSDDAKSCPSCGTDRRNWFARHPLFTFMLIILLLLYMFTDFGKGFNKGFKKGYGSNEAESQKLAANSEEQQNFHRMRSTFRNEYKTKNNEIQKSDVFTDAENATLKFAENFDWTFKNWSGKISEITTNKGGDRLFISVISDVGDQRIKYTVPSCVIGECGIPKGDPVYQQVRNLEVGQSVLFSGKFSANEKGKVNELSVTEVGSIELPEYTVEFLNILPLAESNPPKQSELNKIMPSNSTFSKNDFELAYDKLASQIEGKERNCTRGEGITGDLNGDGLIDGIIGYSCGFKGNLGNASAGSGWAIFVSNGKELKFIGTCENFADCSADSIRSGLIYGVQYEYAANDPRCCPSLKTPIKLKLKNKTLIKVD
jgi:hypothetical protein